MSDLVKVACIQFACGESAASDEEQVKRNIETAGRLAKESIFARREDMIITSLLSLFLPILR